MLIAASPLAAGAAAGARGTSLPLASNAFLQAGGKWSRGHEFDGGTAGTAGRMPASGCPRRLSLRPPPARLKGMNSMPIMKGRSTSGTLQGLIRKRCRGQMQA